MKKRTVKGKSNPHAPSSQRMQGMLRIFNETQVRVPRAAIVTIYTKLLKKTCSLNVVCIGDTFSQKLNKAHRQKDAPTNILTFPPNDDGVAELYINAAMVKKMAQKHRISVKKQFLFLYIHGILHLLGHSHGEEMEMLEDRYITMYT